MRDGSSDDNNTDIGQVMSVIGLRGPIGRFALLGKLLKTVGMTCIHTLLVVLYTHEISL
jgi:hypothetical protein